MKNLVFTLAVCMIISLMGTPIMHAYDYEEKSEQDGTISDITIKQSSIQSSTLIDILLDRYPLLKQIIEMILDLLYNWLSDFSGTISL